MELKRASVIRKTIEEISRSFTSPDTVANRESGFSDRHTTKMLMRFTVRRPWRQSRSGSMKKNRWHSSARWFSLMLGTRRKADPLIVSTI